MKKKVVSLLLCTVLGVSLAGCGENVVISEQINVTESTAQPESEKMPALEQAAPEEGASEEVQPVELEECALLGSNFANSLYVTDMTYQLNGGNVMFSPLSLNFALGLVLEGTDGDSPTRAAIENYLNSSEYSAFARSYMKYAEEVSAREVPEGSTMENHFDIANGIWVNKEYSLLEKYQSTVRESYGAEVESLDFTDPGGGRHGKSLGESEDTVHDSGDSQSRADYRGGGSSSDQCHLFPVALAERLEAFRGI